MQFNYFQNLDSNFLGQNRLVYKKSIPSAASEGASLPDNVAADSGYYYVPRLGDRLEGGKKKPKTKDELAAAKKEQKRAAESAKKEEALQNIVGNLGGAGKLTKEKHNRLKKRMGKEIYSGNEELKEKYFEKVKEAIEKLPEDLLYKFIFAHTPAGNNLYTKSEYKDWNREFAELINPYLPEDMRAKPEEVKKHTYITGGLQNYLVEYFAISFDNANVFEAGMSKRLTNPFIYVDGKMGCYTISVMAEYWNHKYGKEEKNKEKPKLNNADLETGYASKRKNRKLYDRALAILDVQLGRAPRVPLAPKKKWEVRRDKIATNLRSKGATDEALFAFHKAYEEKYKKDMKPLIMALRKESKFDHKSPSVWNAIHTEMMKSNEVYKADFEANSVVSTPGVIPTGAQETKVATNKPTPQPVLKNPELKNEKILDKSVFVRRLMSKINQAGDGGLDFNQAIIDEQRSREDFADRIYNICEKYNLPASEKLMDIVVKKLKETAEDKEDGDIDYGEEIFEITSMQETIQKAEEGRLLMGIERYLKKTYLKEEIGKEEDEVMDEDIFEAEMITQMYKENLDFKGWWITDNEYNAKAEFSRKSRKMCDELNLPLSMKMVESIVKILKDNFVPVDNDVEYYYNPGDAEETSANRKIMDGIKEGLKEKHETQTQPEVQLAAK